MKPHAREPQFSPIRRPTTLRAERDHWIGSFDSMGGSCQVRVDTARHDLARRALELASSEAWRIEAKLSRYRDDNVVDRINRSNGKPIEVDEETRQLLDFAARCHELSEGRFDITSGLLRKIWKFDGSDRVPGPEEVAALLSGVGWEKVEWNPPVLRLPPGMEIDLGGIGKEYAVDRAAAMVGELLGGEAITGTEPEPSTGATGIVVNFGGDLFVNGPRRDGTPWSIGIENPETGADPVRVIQVHRGGLATSGDSRKFLLRDGVRYGHVLDPRTGWPVVDAPRSVTVLADTCSEAGLVATLAMLEGAGAEEFLEEQGWQHWCVR